MEEDRKKTTATQKISRARSKSPITSNVLISSKTMYCPACHRRSYIFNVKEQRFVCIYEPACSEVMGRPGELRADDRARASGNLTAAGAWRLRLYSMGRLGRVIENGVAGMRRRAKRVMGNESGGVEAVLLLVVIFVFAFILQSTLTQLDQIRTDLNHKLSHNNTTVTCSVYCTKLCEAEDKDHSGEEGAGGAVVELMNSDFWQAVLDIDVNQHGLTNCLCDNDTGTGFAKYSGSLYWYACDGRVKTGSGSTALNDGDVTGEAVTREREE